MRSTFINLFTHPFQAYKTRDALHQILPWIYILFLPLLVFKFSISLLLQNGWPDAFYYTGYVHDYSAMIDWYGRTYYSTRVSFIFPERFFVWLLGSQFGYSFFRYILLLAFLASFYKIAKNYCAKPICLLFLTIAAFNPWLLRSIYYDYYDGAALIYIIVALHFILSGYRGKTIPFIASGIFFLMAINCNLYLLLIGGLFLPSYLFLSWHEDYRSILKRIALIFMGILWGELLLSFIVWIEFPQFGLFLEGAAYDIAQFSVKGGNAEYIIPLTQVFNSGHGITLFLPVTLLILSVTFWAKISFTALQGPSYQNHYHSNELKRFNFALIIYLGLLSVSFIFLHFSGLWIISWFSYFSYALPATYLVLLGILMKAYSLLKTRQIKAVCFSVVCLYFFCLWLVQSGMFSNFNNKTIFLGLLIFALLFCCTILLSKKREMIGYCMIMGSTMIIPFFCGSPLFQVFSLPKSVQVSQIEWDVYHGSVELQQWLVSIKPKIGPVKFWYDDEILEGKLSSIHSTMLWGENLLGQLVPGSKRKAMSMRMPQMDNITLENVLNTRCIVILGESKEKLVQAKQALEKLTYSENIDWKSLMEKKYNSKTLDFYVLALIQAKKNSNN